MLPKFTDDLKMLFEVLDSGEAVILEDIQDVEVRSRLYDLFKSLSLNMVSVFPSFATHTQHFPLIRFII